jgi:hypothetical protein
MKSQVNGDVMTVIASYGKSLVAGITCACLTFMGVQAMAATREVTIVLPSAPTRIERFAAKELSKYLAAAAEVKASIVTDAPKSTVAGGIFWVGNLTEDDRLSHCGFPLAKMGAAKLAEDGVCVVGDAQQVLLVGQGKRGALSAVYTYLENVIGCHWPEPGQDFVPKLSDWKPAPVHLVVNPPFAFRGIAIHGACSKEYFSQIVDWLAKNRMNAFQVFPGHYDWVHEQVIEAVLDRGLLPNIGGHSREYYLPTAKYRPEHPDWFATNQGKKTEQICYSNFDSVPTYAANVVAYLKSHPEIAMASLWPNDGYGFCECARCKAAAGNGADLLLAYVNRVAEKVHAEVPGVKFEFLAYIHYLTAPTHVKPLPYVVPTFCEHYGSIGARDHFHPITDDRAANRRLREELEKWISVSRQVTEFSYYGDDCIKRFLYRPIPDVIVADYRYYERVKLAGHFVLSTNPNDWWSHAVTLYACARASWDRDLDARQIEANYYQSLFGSAAEAMQKHAAILGALHEQHAVVLANSTSASAEQHAARLRQYAEGIRDAKACLELAQSTHPNPYATERIRKLRIATDYLDLWFQIQCDQHRFVYAEKSAQLRDRILANVDRALKLDVITQEDVRGCGQGTAVLDSIRKFVAATPCQPARPPQKNGK